MTYVLKDEAGNIIATSRTPLSDGNWESIDEKDSDYLTYLHNELSKQDKFMNSDIQLARVLEDLIGILITRNLISFTDFPSAAQQRLTDRQTKRSKSNLTLLDDEETY